MGKDSLWKRRPAAWFLSTLGGFPVTRGTADREALKRCIGVLESGEPLVLFPEGERKSGPVVQPLFDGAAYVALRAGVPIVPVGIGGSERVMPKGARFIRPRKVHVIVGTPFLPPPSEGRRMPRSVVKQYSADLHAELQRLFDDAQARVG
jgi:1-acyl-sn-glycerol-3-phosphate acyltransferase